MLGWVVAARAWRWGAAIAAFIHVTKHGAGAKVGFLRSLLLGHSLPKVNVPIKG